MVATIESKLHETLCFMKLSMYLEHVFHVPFHIAPLVTSCLFPIYNGVHCSTGKRPFPLFHLTFHTCPFMSSKNTNGATTKIHHSTTKSKEGKILLVLLLWIIIGFINNMNLNLCSLILSCPEDPSVHVRVYYLSRGAWAMFNRTKPQKIVMMN